MPYSSVKDLPDNVKVLPKHAQEIFKEAYNSAWDQYEDPAKRRGQESREEVANKVAWAAIKKKYHKQESGKWVADT